MTEHAIELRDLTKVFTSMRKSGRLRRTRTEVTAVDHISFSIDKGSFVGVIGPNGAGKSTTIKMLTGVLAPTSGACRVLGYTPLTERTQLAGKIGVVFGQRTQLWWDLPLEESYTLLRHIYRVSAIDFQKSRAELVDQFDVGNLLDQPVRTLSLGQRMRAELVASLLHRPTLLFLDEPTIGLDVVSKFAMRDALQRLNTDHGTTIVLTTHDLADIERLCERVVIIDHGRVIRDEPLTSLMTGLDPGVDLEELVRRIYVGSSSQ